jgi:hypothetical protein
MKAKQLAFIRLGQGKRGAIRFRQRDIDDYIERRRIRSIAG